MSDISRLEALFPQTATTGVKPSSSEHKESGSDVNFSDMLKDALESVNDAQSEVGDAVRKVLSEESKDIHSTMIALEKANFSLKMMLEVRNKILEAYQEVMRTQV